MADFVNELRFENLKFHYYRALGKGPDSWTDAEARAARPLYLRQAIPRPGRPRKFQGVGPWVPRRYLRPRRRVRDIAGASINPSNDASGRQAQNRYREIRDWFGAPPRYVLKKPLGFGGNGIVLHYQYTRPRQNRRQGRDIAVKFPLGGWRSDGLILEELKTKKLAKSAHCVQVINRRDIGKNALRDELIVPLPGDDSSVDGDSSGDESIDYARPRARPQRRNLAPAQMNHRIVRWEARQEEILDKYYHPEFVGRGRARRDFTILEYLENGDLSNLIYKLAEDKETNGRVPNRVLWAFWLCRLDLIPYQEEEYLAAERRYQPDDLNEEVPPAEKRWRRQRMVHFDLDPLNGGFELDPGTLAEWDNELKAKLQTVTTEKVTSEKGPPAEANSNNDSGEDSEITIVSGESSNATGAADNNPPQDGGSNENLENQKTAGTERPDKFRFVAPRPDRLPGEHEIIPRLKIADFGHSQTVKPQKRNVYYFNNRWRAKDDFFAPEQFGAEWEHINPDANGPDCADHEVAGQYGPPTNIWSIAWVMWILITKHSPPTPPQPQLPPTFPMPPLSGMTIDDIVDQQEVKVSYCPWLLDQDNKDYDWVDKELRTTIFECLNHNPGDRPTLETLLGAAKNGYRKRFHGEDDGYIRSWIRKWLYDAPIQTGDAGRGGAGDAGPSGAGLPGGGLSGGPPGAPPGAPSGGPPGGPPGSGQPVGGLKKKDDAAAYAAAKNDPHYALNIQFQTHLNQSFPHGYQTIFNAAPALRCGMFALRDSIQAQLSREGVAVPSVEGLQQIFDDLQAAGDFNMLYVQDPHDLNADDGIESNYFQDQLALVLQTWGQIHNLELQLGYIRRDAPAYLQPTEFANPTTVWIFNNKVVVPAPAPNAAGPTSGPRYNHWMGLAPNPAPEPEVEQQQVDDLIPPGGENGLSDLEGE
ncbi:hypothetical protein DL764_004022 [Monosporascus ibericus]|uniref:Protein kinase domain-containing protein n=1 Tax=Monosporascus ibericus TaxID=155417 RepID=A0A4Q4TEA1_9PEZI|nr:hypothetical protein DL764_004022 [Monosporascus ibericus]